MAQTYAAKYLLKAAASAPRDLINSVVAQYRPIYPTVLIFHCTFVCDARCEMCSNWERGDRKSDMSLAEVERTFKSDLWKNIEIANLSGGEPTTRNDMVEICRIMWRMRIHRIPIVAEGKPVDGATVTLGVVPVVVVAVVRVQLVGRDHAEVGLHSVQSGHGGLPCPTGTPRPVQRSESPHRHGLAQRLVGLPALRLVQPGQHAVFTKLAALHVRPFMESNIDARSPLDRLRRRHPHSLDSLRLRWRATAAHARRNARKLAARPGQTFEPSSLQRFFTQRAVPVAAVAVRPVGPDEDALRFDAHGAA